jgi:pyruvate/2-oxoglutarate dehydrogenase complex dihydrolipoamide dehydrogenase (E3) component
MSTDRSDPRAVVIGSGSAGLTVAIGLAGLGHRVAVVERGPVGGDCTNVGCIPSKTLIHLARTGVASPWGRVQDRRDGLEHEEAAMLENHPDIELVRGEAQVTAPGRVTVSGADGSVRHLRAPHIVVATGSRPITIEVPGLGPERTLTNETFFDLDDTPGHLVVIGGGPIAVELASAVERMGARVTLIEAADRILPREDAEASAIVERALRTRTIDVHVGTTAQRFDEATETLHLSDGAAVGNVDRVLIAIGRRPRTEGLGLAALGLDTGGAPLATDSWGRTEVDGIWAVGDVTGRTATTHGANAMARRTVQAIGLPKLPRISRTPTIPSATFTDPEVASVGLSRAEIERRWPADARLRLHADLADTDRGLTDDITDGAVLVDVERFTGRILRATIVGPSAAEAIGIFTLAIDRRISMHRMYRLVHPYPTFASAIGAVADDFSRQTLPNLRAEASAWARHLPRTLRSTP